MVKRPVISAALAVAAVALAAWAAFYFRDAARILRATEALARMVSKAGSENPIAGAARAEQFAGFFVERPALALDFMPAVPDGRRELGALVFQVRSRADEIKVQLFDPNVRMAPDHRTAELEVTARGTVRASDYSDSVLREFHLSWVKTPDGWKISRAETVEAIRHPLAQPQ